MIFVTVGSQKFPFNRLIKKVDQLVREGGILEEVCIQTGTSDYTPRSCRYKAFYDQETFKQMVGACSVLITHGGVGTVIDAVRRGKKVVAVPRLARYGEHVDDHQLQILERFHEMNLIEYCLDIEKLGEAVKRAQTREYAAYPSNTGTFVESVDRYIRSLNGGAPVNVKPKRRLRVLVIGPSHIRSLGGMAAVIRDIKESRLLNREFDIRIFPSYIDGNLALRLLYSGWGYLRFLTCFRQYDLFHIHTAERGSTFRKNFYLRKIKKAGKRAIVHIHGAEYLTFYDGLGPFGRRIVDRFFCRADLVLALSDSWRRELEARFHTGTCRTLNNGIDTVYFKAAAGDVKNLRNSFLMLGRLGKRKGTYDLIDAVELAVRKNPEISVCLAGDGEVEKVRRLVEEKGLKKYIHVPGWVDGRQKLEYLKRAATLVLPSYYEGLPMAVLEGMAGGKAILSTCVGAIPEVVSEENGILVQPGDVAGLAEGLLRLSSDTGLLETMSRNNMEKAGHCFSVSQIHRQLAGYYRQAMK